MARRPSLSRYDIPERSYCAALGATALSILTGLIIGAFVASTVGCSLVEISISDGFSTVFGVLIVFTGILLCARMKSMEDAPRMVSFLVFFFSFIMVLSGIFCFVLNKNWVNSLSVTAKIPMYAVLGTTLTFCLAFSIIDILNSTYSCIWPDANALSGVVKSRKQILLIFVAALILGGTMGLVFGTLDVEDDDERVTRMREEQLFSVPLGGIAGAVLGFTNLFLNDQIEASGVLYGFDSLGIQDDI